MKRLALALTALAVLVGVDCVAYKQTKTTTSTATNWQAPAPEQATTHETAGSGPPSGSTQSTTTSTSETRVGPFQSKSSETTAQSGSPQTFTGEIMDNACAAMGSHDAMMKQEGAKDAKECTLDCVNHGSKFVLYDAGSKTTYQLSDQSKAKNYAGQKVKVTGTSDRTTNTIDVESIDVA